MTAFIALTADEIAKMRQASGKPYGDRGWFTSPGHALDPIPLADGVTFILPLEITQDPAHAEVLALFKADPRIQIDLKAQTKPALDPVTKDPIKNASVPMVREVAEVEFAKPVDVVADADVIKVTEQPKP